MPKYLFTGGYPRVLTGLRQGVNAQHDGTPYGASIEPQTGDTVTTSEPYVHPELQLEDEAAQPAVTAEPQPAPIEVQLAAQPEVVLDAEALSHLSPDVIAQIQAAEHAETPSAPAPETPQEQ